jgi:hypothetical protein
LVDLGCGSEAIVFQFEDVVGIIERLLDQSEQHRADAWEHVRVNTTKMCRPPLALLGDIACQAQQFVANVSFPAFGGRDPMPFNPRRIMADVLLMPTLKIGDPIRLLILVEANNFSRLTVRHFWLLHATPTYTDGSCWLGE